MTQLLENPLPTVMFGILAAAIIGGLWMRVGRIWLLYLLGAVIALTVGLVLLEKWVETYREQVECPAERDACLEANDLPAVLDFIHTRETEIRNRVQREFPGYHFREVKVARNLEIVVNEMVDPPQAEATFNVIARGDFAGGTIQNQPVVRFVRLDLELEDDGKWRVIDYHHSNPRDAFMESRPN